MKPIKQFIYESLNPLRNLTVTQLCAMLEGIKSANGDIQVAQNHVNSVLGDSRKSFIITQDMWRLFNKFAKDMEEIWCDCSDELWSDLASCIEGEAGWSKDEIDTDKLREKIRKHINIPNNQVAIVGYDAAEGDGCCFSITFKNERIANEMTKLIPASNFTFDIF